MVNNKKGLWLNENTFMEFQNGKSFSLYEEFAKRSRSLDFYSMGTFLPNPDPILKKAGKDIRVYRELSYDTHVSSCFLSRKAGVLKLDWCINQNKSDKNISKFIEDTFNNFDLFKITSEMLEAVQFGFKPLEIMWQNINSQIIPSDIVGKPSEWFIFDGDNNLRFRAMDAVWGELLPNNKFLCTSHNASYQNPYGEAALSKVFWPVIFKKSTLKFWAVFAEKYGMPFLFAKHSIGLSNTEINRIVFMLENMVQDGVAVVPDGTGLELKGISDTNGGEIYKNLIDTCNAEISKALIGQTLTTEIGKTGSYAASQSHMEVREDVIISDKKMIENTYNHLIKLICELNFGKNKNLPTFSLFAEEDVDRVLADRDKVLFDIGIRYTKKYFIKNYGFEEDDFDLQPASTFQFPQQQQPPLSFAEEITAKDIEQNISNEFQEAGREMLAPVIDMINKSNSFEDIMDSIKNVYPQMPTDKLEHLFERGIFLADALGRIEA